MKEIKTIIFDYGNVICKPQELSDVDNIADCVGISRDIVHKYYWHFRLDFDRHALNAEQYWRQIGRLAGKELSTAQIEEATLRDARSWSRPNRQTVEWIKHLQRHNMRTAILSNMPLALKQIIERECDWLPDFDVKVYSCDVLSNKPDFKIYQHCLQQLQVEPQDVLFLDDRQENIEAARALGMHAEVFTTLEAALASISTAIALPPFNALVTTPGAALFN